MLVARQDLEDKPADAAAHGVLLKVRLQRSSKPRPLKFGCNHEGYLGEIGRWVQKIARAPNDLLILAWPDDAQERDVGLVVYVAQRLQLPVGKRAYAAEEPCVDVVLCKAMEQSLQGLCVSGASRTYHDLGAVLHRDDPFLVDGIGGVGGEILVGSNVAQFFGRCEQLLTPTWMRDLDQCQCSFPNRLAE